MQRPTPNTAKHYNSFSLPGLAEGKGVGTAIQQWPWKWCPWAQESDRLLPTHSHTHTPTANQWHHRLSNVSEKTMLDACNYEVKKSVGFCGKFQIITKKQQVVHWIKYEILKFEVVECECSTIFFILFTIWINLFFFFAVHAQHMLSN